jgi:hypothetical protein
MVLVTVGAIPSTGETTRGISCILIDLRTWSATDSTSCVASTGPTPMDRIPDTPGSSAVPSSRGLAWSETVDQTVANGPTICPTITIPDTAMTHVQCGHKRLHLSDTVTPCSISMSVMVARVTPLALAAVGPCNNVVLHYCHHLL